MSTQRKLPPAALARQIRQGYARSLQPDPAPLRAAYDHYPRVRTMFSTSPYNASADIESGRVTADLVERVLDYLFALEA